MLYSLYLQHPIVTTDSRRCPKGSIFFALKGDNFDGNLFAAKALDAGAAYAVVDNPTVVLDNRYILVPDVLTALQQLAAEHRRHLSIPIIGITGTNGKTTTKELVATVLSQSYRVTATVGNLNNHIGVPLTLLSITPDTEIAVVEMGANHPGEIADLAAIVRPTAAIITSIGKAHLQGFGSLEGVLNTKRALYDQVIADKGLVFVNTDDTTLSAITSHYSPVISYTTRPDTTADIKTTITPSDSPFLAINWAGHRINTSLIGSYNAYNIAAAIAIGTNYGIGPDKIATAITEYTPTNSRSQLIKTDNNTIIADAYNANPTSMAAAINSFASIQADNKIAILGDMLELGDQSLTLHMQIIDLLTSLHIDAILVGSCFAQCHSPYTTFADRTQLIHHLSSHPITHHTILVKGSNGIGLQSIIPQL